MDLVREESIERAREIVRTLRSGEESNREELLEELRKIEDKYRLIFY